MTLFEVFAEALKDNPQRISDETSRTTHRRWDSLAHIQLVVLLEDEFHVKLTLPEIDQLSSVGGARALLKSKGVTAA